MAKEKLTPSPDPISLETKMGLKDLFVPSFSNYTEKIDLGISKEMMDSYSTRMQDNPRWSIEESDKLMQRSPKIAEPLTILNKFIKQYDDVDIFYTKRSIGRPRKYLCTNHVKKDAIWKPLFRKFRRFIKDYISSQVILRDIEELPFEQRGKIYAELLNLNHDLKKHQRNLNALILIIESQRVTKRRKLVSFYQDAMKEDL